MEKKFTAGVIIVTFLILIASYFLVPQESDKSKPKVLSYNADSSERPQVQIKQDQADFGKMKVSEVKFYDFSLKNIGKKTLQISNIKSSCMCTFGQVIFDGKASGEFAMHAQNGYVAEIPAGKEALIRVTYKPYLMPVSGFVEREVYADTNDPQKPKLVFKVTANVK